MAAPARTSPPGRSGRDPRQDPRHLHRVPRLAAPRRMALGVEPVGDPSQGQPFGSQLGHEREQVGVRRFGFSMAGGSRCPGTGPSRRAVASKSIRVQPNGTRITQAGILLELESSDLLGRYSGGLTHPPITNPGGRRDSGYSAIPTPLIRVPAEPTRQAAGAPFPHDPLTGSRRAGVPTLPPSLARTHLHPLDYAGDLPISGPVR
jgi:hypothetical protein